MKNKSIFLIMIPVVLLGVGGCSQTTSNDDPPKKVEVREPAFDSPSVLKLLDKSRKELASLCDEELAKIRRKEEIRVTKRKAFSLLPEVHLSVILPVWRRASFSEDVDMSLPPYLKPNAPDKLSALHLATYGDAEGALKLIDTTDQATAKQIETLKPKRNFPVEWSRLVALLLYSEELQLADGHPEAAWALLGIHKQLEELPLPNALRTSLLFRGKHLLQQAAKAWNEADKKDLAKKVERAVANWPQLKPKLACPPNCTEAEVVGIFGAQPSGRAVFAEESLRTLDLLGFPIPDEGLGGIVAFLDNSHRLDQILVLYNSVATDVHHPAQFGYALGNFLPGEDTERPLPERVYHFENFRADVVVIPNHPVLNAFVRIDDGDSSLATGLTRDFGPVHLNRSFRQNRLHTDRDQNGNRLKLVDPEILSELKRDFATGTLTSVVLERNNKVDVVDRIIFKLKPDEGGRRSLRVLARRLFEKAGPPRFSYDKKLDVLAAHWIGPQTQYTLKLPPIEKSYDFVVHDKKLKDVAARFRRTQHWDETERRMRLTKKQPLRFLSRRLEGVSLGMTLSQADKSAPVTSTTLTDKSKDRLLFLFKDTPLSKHAWKLRQLVARAGESGKVREIRALYVNPAEARASTMRNKLEAKYGAPDAVPDDQYGVWNDVTSKPRPAEILRWHDDLTTLEWRRFGGQIELILHERQPSSEPLRPYVYLPRGPDKVALGEERGALLDAWNVKTPRMVDDALLLVPRRSSPYAAILVWFKDNRVSRIVARHRNANVGDRKHAANAVRLAWTRNIKSFGWPQRQQFLTGNHLEGWGSRDATTRVRVFWQDGRDGKHLYTEWKTLPTRN